MMFTRENGQYLAGLIQLLKNCNTSSRSFKIKRLFRQDINKPRQQRQYFSHLTR